MRSARSSRSTASRSTASSSRTSCSTWCAARFRFLREQVGFKLAELLKARLAAPPGAVEFLFGDDWESDPIIYSLYADVIAGRLEHDALADILVRLRIDPARLVEIKALSQRIAPADAVRRIFINLERRTPPDRFRAFGARLVPTFNYFQTALVLYEEGMVPLTAVSRRRALAARPLGLYA